MDRKTLIFTYFTLGLTHKEILAFLAQKHNIIISLRTLKRETSKLKLYRRKGHSDITEVALFILEECDSSGRLHGY